MDLSNMMTETRNPDTMHLDEMSPLQIVTAMNREDRKVPLAIEAVLSQIAAAVEAVETAFRNGGRLFYLGAGTSGRLGVLDASECPPTFGVDHGMVVGLIAGGDRALRFPIEGSEDSRELRRQDLADHNLQSVDVITGIAASGRPPYVLGALEYARSPGCRTAAVALQPGQRRRPGCRHCHRGCSWPGSADRLHPPESRHSPKDDSEYDYHRGRGAYWQGLPEPDGRRSPEQRKITDPCRKHRNEGHRRLVAGGPCCHRRGRGVKSNLPSPCC